MKTLCTAALPVLLFVFLHGAVVAQPDSVGATPKLPAHPRLLLLRGEEKALRTAINADPTWQMTHRAILAECDRMLTTAPVQRIQIGRRLLDKSRECLRRVFFLSYAYRLTSNRNYLNRAEQELLAVSAFSDWNPSHFLDVAEMTLGVAIGYDWLYNDLPETSRARIREALLKKGLEPSLDSRNNGWQNVTNNWNQVCNAGMAFGALAIYDEQPILGRHIVNRAIRTVVKPMAEYAPDGAYPEGYNYWGYGTTFNVMLIAGLKKAFGTDFGLAAQPGFQQTADYLLHMTGPSGESFNYSDAGTGGEIQPAMFWFAQQRNKPSLLWVERQRLAAANQDALLRDRLLPAMLLWGSRIRLSKLPPPSATMWAGTGKNPVALFRSSWQDSKALFVGLKAGSPSVSHGHMDVGSFVLEAGGVRWAMDFGMQDYNSLESKGVNLWATGQNAQRWEVFRYNNRVHNTLTVNDQLQRVDGFAPLTRFANQPAFRHAITDMTAVYAGALKSARRGLALLDGRYVAVRDEVEAGAQPATVRWVMLTPAEVTITGPNTAELRKDGQSLTIRVQEPARVTLQTWATDPPHAYDAPNPGTTRVGFEVEIPAGTSGALTVLLLPSGTETKASAPVQPLNQWPRN